MNKDNEEKRWCSVHLTGYWGKDQFNNWYPQCSKGHKLNEQCEIGQDEEEVKKNE